MTGNTLSYQVLRDLGVIRSGFTLNSDHYTDLLALLNQILDQFNTEGLMVYSIERSEYSLTSATENYTLGPSGADFTADRPSWVERAGRIVASGSNEAPIRLLNLEEWQQRQDGLYVDMASPSITLKLRPQPGTGETLVLYTPKLFTSFADGTTAYTFPPGYEKALRAILAAEAVHMFKLYMKASAPELNRIDRAAAAARRDIQRINFRGANMQTDPALLGAGFFDATTGQVL